MPSGSKIKQRIWEVLEPAGDGDRTSRFCDVFILALIALNVLAVIIETIPYVHEHHATPLRIFDLVSVIIFTIEYFLRIATCTVDPRYGNHFSGRLRFALRPISLIDLFAILPFYLPFVGVDPRALRMIRLMRIFRILKAVRYVSSLELIKRVLHSKREELAVTFFIMMFLIVISATVLYYCEFPVQPEHFSSIPASMWWSIATLTTIGYGDIYPITIIGKICASIIALLGIALFALPTAILGAGFIEQIHRKKNLEKCQICGKEFKTDSSPGLE